MKKIYLIIIAAILTIGTTIAVTFGIMHMNNNKKYDLSITTTNYGSVQAVIDEEIYAVEENSSYDKEVSKQSTITLTAIPGKDCKFVEWKVNDATYSTDVEINITIDKDTTVKAVFASTVANITVVDGTFTETFTYNLADNLLQTLKNKYAEPKGYSYTYKIDNYTIVDATSINSNVTITRVKTPIEYTVIFKNGESIIGSDTYTIEDQTVTAPAVPDLEHYDNEAWANFTIPTDLGDFEVQLNKTAIEYPVTYKLPDGYTFDGTATEQVVTYTIENIGATNAPALPEAHAGYTIAWNNTINADNLGTIDTINATATLTTYTVTFKNGDTVLGTDTYTVEDQTITAPAVSTPAHYSAKWNYEIPAELGNIEAQLTIVPIEYTVTFKNGNNVIGSDTYTVEDQTVTAPAVPDLEHYVDEAWANFTIPAELGNFEVQLNKTAINYAVTFKNGSTVVGTDTYTVEDQTITAPTAPSIAHYNTSWNYEIPTGLGNFEVQLTKTAIEYPVTYKLPAGYTFDGTATEQVITYTIENVGATNAPALPEAHAGYTIAWNNTINADNLGTINTIDAVATKIAYKAKYILPAGVTFEDGTTTADVTYYIDTTTITCPKTIATVAHYEVVWNSYSLTYNDTIVEVNGTKTAIEYQVTYKLPAGYTFDGTATEQVVTYTIENVGATNAPALPEAHAGYTIVWNNEITAENLGTVQVINAIECKAITINYDILIDGEETNYIYDTIYINTYDNSDTNIYILDKGVLVAETDFDEFAERHFNNIEGVNLVKINDTDVTDLDSVKLQLEIEFEEATSITFVYDFLLDEEL